MKAVGPAWRLELYHQEAEYGREDPRLFFHRGHVHVAFTGVSAHDYSLWTSILYARLDHNMRVEKVFSPQYDNRSWWEKNWQFFSYADELYAVYSYNPCQILEIDGDKAEL